jgi:prepilin-type N-terminal cleavage/methylation domain-containing protein
MSHERFAVMSPAHQPQRGFSLIEIALVLVVVGLALGGLMSALGSQLENKRISDTQQALEEAKEALIGYAIINKRLPAPATSAVNGVALATCATDVTCTGFIPWATLGSPKRDAWAKLIRYSVTPAFVNNDITVTPPAATKIIRTRAAGVLTTEPPNVPVVIFSHGNANFGTTETGGAIANGGGPGNVDEISNNTGSTGGTAGTIFIRRAPSAPTAAGGEFDDLVVTLTSPTLVARMGKAGAF